ncbi:MAG: hypothetical protein GX051_02040 [Clostridiales bacterium]|nr:hypothetical protein [Clostridiales bacterium]
MKFLDSFGKRIMIFDGAMGSMLQNAELECPAQFACLVEPEKVAEIHRAYIEAGCDVITANTFGANSLKLKSDEYTASQVVEASVKCAVECARSANKNVFTAMDIGPTGRFLYPIGDLQFDTAYEAFGEAAQAGERAGADLILIETMTDTYEMKAAVLAAKEYTSLPVIASFSLDKNGRLLTGADIKTAYSLLMSLGVDGVSLNCGFGPEFATGFAKEIIDFSGMPVLLMPNAGLPEMKNGAACYSLDAAGFASQMQSAVGYGLSAVGGCCGTTPEHIKTLSEMFGSIAVPPLSKSAKKYVTSGSVCVEYIQGKTSVGILLDASSDKTLSENLAKGDLDCVCDAVFDNAPSGAEIYSVCADAPGIDTVKILPRLVSEVQTYISVPLLISSENPDALAQALKIYNGIPLAECTATDSEAFESGENSIKRFGAVKKE